MPSKNSQQIKRDIFIYRTLSSPTSGMTTTVAGPYVSEVTTKSKSWTTTPGFRQKKKSAQLPVNPFTYSHSIVREPEGSWQSTIIDSKGQMNVELLRGGFTQYGLTPSVPFLVPTGPMYDRADRMAVNSLLNQVKDAKVNVAQFYAERRQTLSLITNTASRIAASYEALRSGNIVKAAKSLGGVRPSRRVRRGFRKSHADGVPDAAASAWLQMQYGWIPLLADVKGAVEALHTFTSDMDVIRSVGRGSYKEEDTRKGAGSLGLEFQSKSTIEVFVKYTSFHKVLASATQMSTALGLQNPALLAWELVPYSFVVDWFLPIGNYISSIDATAGLAFSTGSRTLTVRRKVTITWSKSTPIRYDPFNPGVAQINGMIKASKEVIDITRDRTNQAPSVRFPYPKNPLSRSHVTSAISLLVSAFNRRG